MRAMMPIRRTLRPCVLCKHAESLVICISHGMFSVHFLTWRSVMSQIRYRLSKAHFNCCSLDGENQHGSPGGRCLVQVIFIP